MHRDIIKPIVVLILSVIVCQTMCANSVSSCANCVEINAKTESLPVPDIANLQVDNSSTQNLRHASRAAKEGKMFGSMGESSRKKGNKKNKSMMERIMPMMIIPFLVSSAIVPKMLVVIGMLLVKTLFIGKIAAGLVLLNMFRRRTTGGGVYNYDVQQNQRQMPMSSELPQGYAR